MPKKSLKINYYDQETVVKKYDNLRFGGQSGNFVNNIELSFFIKNINKKKNIKLLDAPCGTGRLGKIGKAGVEILGVDTSTKMLKQADKTKKYKKLVKANLDNLPFDKNEFDYVIHLRIFHHYPLKKVKKMLEESKRALKENGYILFETHNRSPKKLLDLIKRDCAQKIHVYSDKEIKILLKELSLKIDTTEKHFFFSPLLYRFLPLFFIKLLYKAEQFLPKQLLVRTYWKVGT